ncbi:hypothetical protein C900_00212 [Fulvivirga imtechensis AK7]|uniref:Uncharacterized protein n=1 Tax=Fulvivirga imtechensis AK7 TaxID=1237149 RepID=L8JM56_9BACT|nr:hypothetical protein C900_00212 [Fulvivirga imtechensis AK7]
MHDANFGANATPTFYGGINTRLEDKGVLYITPLLFYWQ